MDIIMGLIGLLTVLFESTCLHHVSIFEIQPNLSLILVVCWGILQGNETGRRFGIWIGLLQDFLFCKIVGFYGLIYYLLGHCCGYFKQDFHKGHFILPIVIVSVADFLYGIIHYVFYQFFQGNLDFTFYLQKTILPEMFYTSLISLPIYVGMRLLSRGFIHIKSLRNSGKEL